MATSFLSILSQSQVISAVQKYLDFETLGNFDTAIKNCKVGEILSPVDRFLNAASTGDTDALVACLEGGVDVNSTNPEGWTALMHGHHSKCVAILLKYKANVNIQSRKGVTALMLAVVAGDSDFLTILLSNNADPNLQCTDGMTAL